jgi:hypothetical protein
MDFYLDKLIAHAGYGAFGMGLGFGASLGYSLRHRITGLFLSRTGLQVYTNDVSVRDSIADKIDSIDSVTRKSVRKGTGRLMILNPEKHSMSAEIMMVNYEANQPLIYAAYENHHTRELAADGANVYLTSKAHELSEALRLWKKRFPELTDDFIECYVCRWVIKALIPNLRKACADKVEFYNQQIVRHDVSQTLKEGAVARRDKNVSYIKDIEKLTTCADIQNKSSIFLPAQTS